MKWVMMLLVLLVIGCQTTIYSNGYTIDSIDKHQTEGYCYYHIDFGLKVVDRCGKYNIGDVVVMGKVK